RADESGDGGRRLGHLLVGGPAAGRDGVGDAMGQVIVEQFDGDRLQRLGGGRDLVEDLDAVLVLVDHALKAADLTLDPAEALLHGLLVVRISGHGRRIPPGGMLTKPWNIWSRNARSTTSTPATSTAATSTTSTPATTTPVTPTCSAG